MATVRRMRHRRLVVFGLIVMVAGGLGVIYVVRSDDSPSSKIAAVGDDLAATSVTSGAPSPSVTVGGPTQPPTTSVADKVPTVALRRDAPPNKWTSYALVERDVAEADIASEMSRGKSRQEARITIALREALRGPRGSAALSEAPAGDPALLQGVQLSDARLTIVFSPDLPKVMNIEAAEAGAVFNIIMLGTALEFTDVSGVVFSLGGDCQAWADATDETPCHVYSRTEFERFASTPLTPAGN